MGASQRRAAAIVAQSAVPDAAGQVQQRAR